MPVSSSTEHWIKPDALTINLNHFGDPDYLQVSVLAGAVVMAFKQDVIGYNAAHNYRTWPLEAANTYLETSSAYNVYARLTRSEVNARALIVYDTVLRDIEGREISYANDGSEQIGESDSESFYIFLGQISGSVNKLGEKVNREWITTLRFGVLDTTEQKNDLGLLFNQMFVPHFDNPNNPEELTWIEALSNLCVAGGITSYLDNKKLNIPSIYDGLPIDWSTIYWEEVKDADGNVTGRVLKAAAGSSGEGGDVVVSGITVEQLAAYLSTNKYATQPWVEDKGYLTSVTSAMVTGALGFTPFDAASFTKANIKSELGIADWALASRKPSYTYSEISGLGAELSKYIPISGYTEVLGEKNFTGGLKVNGCPLVYDATNKYWKFEGDILVTGGVTTHASDSAFKPSTIMDALLIDSTTLGINDDGELYVKGGSGGLTEVHWGDVLDRPSKLSQFTDDVVAGKYLPLNTSTTNILTSSDSGVLNFKSTSSNEVGIRLFFNETNGGGLWYNGVQGMYLYNAASATQLGLLNDGTPYYQDLIFNKRHLWHSGNFNPANYLPTTGGTLTGSGNDILVINRTDGWPYIRFMDNGKGLAYFGVNNSKEMVFIPQNSAEILKVLHSGNYSSYALPITGGTISSTETLPITISNNVNDGEFQVGIRLLNPNKTNTNGNTFGTAQFGYTKSDGVYMFNYDNYNYYNCAIGITDDGIAYVGKGGSLDTKYKIWHEGNHGSGSGLDADLLDGLDSSAFFQSKGRFWSTYINSVLGNGAFWTAEYTPVTGAYNYGTILNFRADSRQTQFYITDGQQKAGTGGRIFFRDSWNAQETMTSRWLEIITNENIGSQTVSKANQLTTARTIWGQSFDGTGNVSGTLHTDLIRTTDNTWVYGWGDGKIMSFGSSSGCNETSIYGQNVILKSYSSTTQKGEIILNSSGNVGIGTTHPSQKLHVNGNILGHAIYFANGTTYYLGSTGNINCLALTANGATTLKSTLGVTGAVTMESNLLVKGHVTSYSQRSLKNVIDERGLSLEELVTIKPTRYTWKDGRDELVHIGGIADDVQKVLPEVVFSNNGTLTMDYAMAGFAIAASLIEPVAKHEEDIESLKKRIKELEMEVERLTMN